MAKIALPTIIRIQCGIVHGKMAEFLGMGHHLRPERLSVVLAAESYPAFLKE